MAFLDLHEGILDEFVGSAAWVQLPLDYGSETSGFFFGDGRSARQTTRDAMPISEEESRAMRNERRRRQHNPRRPSWKRGLVLVNQEDARERRNARRRERYAANIEAERAKTRERMRRWAERRRAMKEAA